MRVALVALPWALLGRPSAALGVLAPYVRREIPGTSVSCLHAFVPFAKRIGVSLYDEISQNAHTLGELLYLPFLYPEKREDVRSHFVRWAVANMPAPIDGTGPPSESWERAFEDVQSAIDQHFRDLLESVAGVELVGMTTSFGQLFANLAFARLVKERTPSTLVVLGGSTVASRVGASILREYPQVDYIVQGEGERPLTALLRAMEAGERASIPGVLTREPNGPAVAALSEVGSLDELPIPDFDAYAELVEDLSIGWVLPIEGSRGCWWDRSRRSGPKATCYFCNLNVQWNGYREKSADRLTRELAELSERYSNLNIFFLDNILRVRGVEELAAKIAAHGRDYRIFYEMRAHVRPDEIVALWEAGLREAQFGIEGLSTSYLRRIGKGTSTIQNLQAMRLCAELGIESVANLIVGFPGATEEEVAETAHNIVEYALSYQPLQLSEFRLGVDATVDVLRGELGLASVRNADYYRVGMPDEIWHRLDLHDLDYDLHAPSVDWSPVARARARWVEVHAAASRKLLVYQDGGTFLNVADSRQAEPSEGTFRGLERELYLFCMEIRTWSQIVARFVQRYGHDDEEVRSALDSFVSWRIMFAEDEKYLSLAVAQSPVTAARRIRAQQSEATPPSRQVRLEVLG